MPSGPDNGGILRTLREHPDNAPLPSPSGRIEIASRRIESFGYADCPGHPAWREPADAPDERHPLWLVANQPATRLHSQLNFRGHSAGAKLHGREVIRLHPADAAERGVSNGDIVRVFDDRGACSAAAALTADIRHGVAQLPTGAWYDPEDPAPDTALCIHGNPNVLTRDVGTSSPAQGCTGQLTTVQVERFTGALPRFGLTTLRKEQPGDRVVVLSQHRDAADCRTRHCACCRSGPRPPPIAAAPQQPNALSPLHPSR